MDSAKIINEGLPRAAGAVSGGLLALTNIVPYLAPIQLFALMPIIYIGAKREFNSSKIFTAAIYMGLFYTIPQMIALRMPIPFTLILLTYLCIIMSALTIVSAYLMTRNIIWGCFAVGAFMALLDWANFTILPLWGTSQSIARPWSLFPEAIQFTSLTGIIGIAFVLGTTQALAVNTILNPQMRKKLIAALIITVLIFVSIDAMILIQQPVEKIKVAALGWTTKNFSDVEYPQTDEGFNELFAKPAIEAARQGAKLIVSPEMGFYINEYDRQEWMERFKKIAAENNVYLAVGYFDPSAKLNQLIYITPDGQLLPEYSKTYLIPVMDKYEKGDGQLRIADINGISAGGMICQDDNFTRFSREYGRKKVSIVAVPTMDWKQVKNAHLQSSIHRAIESRYAIIRSTMNGISAIISPTGKILGECDHVKKGAGMVIAQVPVYKYTSLFSFAGYWFAVASAAFLIIFIVSTSGKKILLNQKEISKD
jgi:apolipoprotein N-acyltransferase